MLALNPPENYNKIIPIYASKLLSDFLPNYKRSATLGDMTFFILFFLFDAFNDQITDQIRKNRTQSVRHAITLNSLLLLVLG